MAFQILVLLLLTVLLFLVLLTWMGIFSTSPLLYFWKRANLGLLQVANQSIHEIGQFILEVVTSLLELVKAYFLNGCLGTSVELTHEW